MDEDEAQYNEEEEQEGNEEGEEEEVDESYERVDNPINDDSTVQKTLYDDEGNELSFVFDKFYMVSKAKKT